MSRLRKYPKVKGNWVYGHITPDGKIYIGKSGRKQCNDRWQPSHYTDKSLQPYIEKYGWDNIKHIVFKDGLTKEQAEQLEGLLIKQAKADGWCININNGGGEAKENPKKYRKQYYEKNKEKVCELTKKLYSTPEGKIYSRVKSFNQYHPDRIIETPMEAKQKYLETGYIPNYIKNNDLIMKG